MVAATIVFQHFAQHSIKWQIYYWAFWKRCWLTAFRTVNFIGVLLTKYKLRFSLGDNMRTICLQRTVSILSDYWSIANAYRYLQLLATHSKQYECWHGNIIGCVNTWRQILQLRTSFCIMKISWPFFCVFSSIGGGGGIELRLTASKS